MALIATKGEIPPNAVELDRTDAVQYQWQQIESWPIKSDVWPFRWGLMGLSALAGGAGMYINSRYRLKLKLRKFGFVSTSFPMIVAPAMFAVAFHTQVVTTDLFLNDTKCPLCLQYRAAMLQTATAVVYPVIMAPIVNALFAIRYGTYRMPYWNDFRGTFSLWWKFTKPMGQSLLFISCIQMVAASYITYKEGEKLYQMNMRILNMQKALIDKEKNCEKSTCK